MYTYRKQMSVSWGINSIFTLQCRSIKLILTSLVKVEVCVCLGMSVREMP